MSRRNIVYSQALRAIFFMALTICVFAGTLKAQNQDFAWFRQIDGYGNADKYVSIACDTNGNLYGLAAMIKSSTETDWGIFKYSSAGWLIAHTSFAPGGVSVPAMLIVNSGYVYATGTAVLSTGYTRMFTVKLDTNLNAASGWSGGILYPSSGTGSPSYDAVSIEVDGNGNVLVGGDIYSSPSDIMLVKYGSGGGTPSTLQLDMTGHNLADTLRSMAMDANSNVYLAAITDSVFNTNEHNWKYTVAKVSSGFTLQWSPSGGGCEYSGLFTVNCYNSPRKVVTLPSGSIVVTGISDTTSTANPQIVTVKFNGGTGALLNSARDDYYHNTTEYDTVGDMEYNTTTGYLYVCGTENSNSTEVALRYDTTSLTLLGRAHFGGGSSTLYGVKIAVDHSGNMWVATNSYDHSSGGWSNGFDIGIASFDSSGNELACPLFDPTYSNPNLNNGSNSGPNDYCFAMATDGANGNIYLAGFMSTSLFAPTTASAEDLILVKYASGKVFTLGQKMARAPYRVTGSTTPSQYELRQNYPNPFNPTTTISYSVPAGDAVTLKVYDITGKVVRTLIDGQFVTSGDHQVVFDAGGLASGAYFYRLTSNSGKFADIRKMMFIK